MLSRLSMLDGSAHRKADLAAGVIHALGIGGRSRPAIAREVFMSLWRSHLILQYINGASKESIWSFLDANVHVTGPDLRELEKRPQGAIIATPHYGAFLPLCVYLIQLFDQGRKLHVMFNDPAKTPSNRGHEDLFRRVGHNAEFHYPDRRGIIAVIKALKRGEILAIMPDVYFQSETLLSVPFFDRLLRMMPGTAYFACKAGVPIVPIYSCPRRDFGFDLEVQPHLQPGGEDEDEDLAVYRLSCDYAANMERRFTRDPFHWIYWDNLMSRSTAFVDRGGRTDIGVLQQELHRLFASAAPMVRGQPALCQSYEQLQAAIAAQEAA
ncbi:lysophospholipid acyltransferase family protein [Cognatiluteimonas telluris]|uniref:lysophospholipid acyltransferase family protein n=1 Tax=Cognatiluteimonas telluris TaxID=1104775 RepID=UPI00140BAAD7|nr:lysophospholipid acyltransferase family protein [Lysobacter telluris]